MPKKKPYPLNGLGECLALAENVHKMGNKASVIDLATRMNRKISGPFQTLVSSAVKFQLVQNRKAIIELTQTGLDLLLAYTEEAFQKQVSQIISMIPIYQILKSNQLNNSRVLLAKQLEKEFLISSTDTNQVIQSIYKTIETYPFLKENHALLEAIEPSPIDHSLVMAYEISIKGPGIQYQSTIQNQSDFSVIDALIQKLKTQVLRQTHH